MMENEVFKRSETTAALVSPRTYNFLIGLTLCWGFFVNWWMIQTITPAQILSMGLWPFLIGYFICCFAGIYLFNTSHKPIVSFLGYNLVVLPFGLVINVVVSQYSQELVMNAISVTGGVTFLMMFLGTLFPTFFQKIHRALGISLLLVIVVEFANIFFFKADLGFIDWIVVFIFCGYIGYDWGRANMIPKTADNAIDSAAALYMDIINLFLRILRILGRRK